MYMMSFPHSHYHNTIYLLQMCINCKILSLSFSFGVEHISTKAVVSRQHKKIGYTQNIFDLCDNFVDLILKIVYNKLLNNLSINIGDNYD